MRWFLLLQGCLLMVFSIAAAQDDALEIKAFLKKIDDSYAVQFKTSHTMPDTNITKYHVIKTVEGTPPQQTDAYTDSAADEKGSGIWEVTFDDPVDLTVLSSKAVHLVLNGLNANDVPLIKGDISIPSFPDVAQDFSGQLATINDPLLPSLILKGKTLRVTATSLGGFSSIIPVPGVTMVELNNVRYYLEAGDEVSYSLCMDDTIQVCDAPVAMDQTPMIKSMTVDAAKLSYEDPDTSAPKVVLTVTSEGTTPSTKLEVILNKDSSPSLLLPADGITSVALDLSSYAIGSGMTLEIIGLDADIMVEYVEHPIIDYEVYGTSIGTTSLEVRWNFQTGKNTYFISRDGGGTGFKEALVACNLDSGSTVCFGYFPGLDTNAYYRVTVDEGDGSKKTNSIESAPIAVGTSPAQGLQLQHRLDWHRNGMEAILRICFNHSSQNYERDFAHYELVIINNNDGKWFKHKLMTQDTTGDLCFSPQAISKQDFFSSPEATIIVIQRATDGLTVLSSGETQLLIRNE